MTDQSSVKPTQARVLTINGGSSSIKFALYHRVVHGMKHIQPEIVTQDLLDELHRISPYVPKKESARGSHTDLRWPGIYRDRTRRKAKRSE